MDQEAFRKLKDRVFGEEKKLHRAFYLGVFAFVSLFLFYNLYRIVFAVHDDILMYAIARNGNIGEEALFAAKFGRLSQLWDYLLLSIPFLANKLWFYKMIAYLSILFDVWAMWYFVRKHIDRSFADLCAISFMAFATISPQHNLFITYALCHQIPIGLFFLALHYFLRFYEGKRKKDQILSCVFYLASCMIYETFLVLMLVFGVAACFLVGREKKGFLKFCRDVLLLILPQLLCAASYAVAHTVWQHYYPSPYEGLSLYLDEPLYSAKAVYKFSISLFPLGSMNWLHKTEGITFAQFLHGITIASVAKALLVAGAFGLVLVMVAKRVKFKGHLVVMAVGTLAPCILIGFNLKYVNVAKSGVTTYIPSFYSYVFLIVLFCGLVCLVYKFLKPLWMRGLYVAAVLGLVIVLSLASDFTVDYWKARFLPQEVRYENFDRAVSSDVVTNCDASWQIYAPDNTGIHSYEGYTLKYLMIYDDTPAGGFVLNASEIDWSKHVLCLRSDISYQFMVAAEVDENYMTDKIAFFTSLDEPRNIVLQTDDGEEVIYQNVSDGDVIESPEGKRFDMSYRAHS